MIPVSDMQKMGIGVTSSASYTLNLAGNTASYNRATVLGLDEGHPVAAQMSGNSVSKLKKLSRLQKDIQRVENSLAYGKDGKIYPLGDNVLVYKKLATSQNYNLVDFEDVDFESGSFEYYYLGTLSKGAKIRVIIWTVQNNN